MMIAFAALTVLFSLFLLVLGTDVLRLRRANAALHTQLYTLGELILKNSQRIGTFEDHVAEMNPGEILASLKNKERFLDQANERIDNAIATARNIGETAGDNAARALIRACLENAATGKGPPLSILPMQEQARRLRSKNPTVHVEGGGGA